MRQITIIVLVLVGLLSMGTGGMAAKKDKEVDWRLRKAVSRLRPRKHVRVQSTGAALIEGRVQTHTEDSLFVTTDTGETGFSLTEIEAVWIHSDAAATGILVGGVVGILVGARVGDRIPYAHENAWLTGAAVGLGVFGLLGGVVGSAVPKWVCKYRSPTYRKPSIDNSAQGQSGTTEEEIAEVTSETTNLIDNTHNAQSNRLRIGIMPDVRGGMLVTASISF